MENNIENNLKWNKDGIAASERDLNGTKLGGKFQKDGYIPQFMGKNFWRSCRHK